MSGAACFQAIFLLPVLLAQYIANINTATNGGKIALSWISKGQNNVETTRHHNRFLSITKQ